MPRPGCYNSLSKSFLCSDLIGGRRKSRKHSGYSCTSKVERTELTHRLNLFSTSGIIKENFPDLGQSNLRQLECHCLGWKRWSKRRRRHLDTGFECPLNLRVARLNRHLCLSPEFSKDVQTGDKYLPVVGICWCLMSGLSGSHRCEKKKMDREEASTSSMREVCPGAQCRERVEKSVMSWAH